MNTSITEKDIAAWLNARAIELHAVSKEHSSIAVEITIYHDGRLQPVKWTTYVHNDCHRSEETFSGALTQTLRCIDPKARAEGLRKRAAAFLAEAAALTDQI